MEFRTAKPGDADAIRTVARDSLHASYDAILGEETVENAVANWYGGDELTEKIEDDQLLLGVLEVDGELAGFSQSYVADGEGRIQWLHVAPDHRGKGVGRALLSHTRTALANRGVSHITGVVLAENEDGNEFYSEHEFTLDDQVTVSIAGTFHAENVYHDVAGQERSLEPIDTPDGEMYVDMTDSYRGKEAPFYPVYRSPDGARRWGWYCGACESTDNAMDTLGRVVCNDCSNVRKADRWDAAYL